MRKMTKQERNNRRDETARCAETAANEGHYLDRLENIAICLNHSESIMAVGALKQLYTYSGCKPKGSDGIQYEISMRLLIIAERDYKFTKLQLSKLWYGIHWDARESFGLKFPYEKNEITNSMRTDK